MLPADPASALTESGGHTSKKAAADYGGSLLVCSSYTKPLPLRKLCAASRGCSPPLDYG